MTDEELVAQFRAKLEEINEIASKLNDRSIVVEYDTVGNNVQVFADFSTLAYRKAAELVARLTKQL